MVTKLHKLRQGDFVLYRAGTGDLVSAKVLGRCGPGFKMAKIESRFVMKDGRAQGGYLGHEYIVDPSVLRKPQTKKGKTILGLGSYTRALNLATSSTR